MHPQSSTSPTTTPTCPDCCKPISSRAMRCRSCANRTRWQTDDPRRDKLRERNSSAREGHTPYTDREWLRSRYEDRQMSLREIARDASCGLRTIARWMSQHGIPRRENAVATRLRDQHGAANPHWKGGCTRCPACGGQKSTAKSISVCQSCRTARKRGAGNPNWRGLANVMTLVRQWTADNWRPLVFERDGYRCQECGDARGGNLHAHHCMPLSDIVKKKRAAWQGELATAEGRLSFVQVLLADTEVTAIENGVTLCDRCHLAKHVKLGVS